MIGTVYVFALLSSALALGVCMALLRSTDASFLFKAHPTLEGSLLRYIYATVVLSVWACGEGAV